MIMSHSTKRIRTNAQEFLNRRCRTGSGRAIKKINGFVLARRGVHECRTTGDEQRVRIFAEPLYIPFCVTS